MWLQIKGEPYKDPPPAFQPGDRVWYEADWEKESGEYEVIGATHAHVELKGKPVCVSAWRCTKVKKRRKSSDREKKFPRRNTDAHRLNPRYDRQKHNSTVIESEEIDSTRP